MLDGLEWNFNIEFHIHHPNNCKCVSILMDSDKLFIFRVLLISIFSSSKLYVQANIGLYQY